MAWVDDSRHDRVRPRGRRTVQGHRVVHRRRIGGPNSSAYLTAAEHDVGLFGGRGRKDHVLSAMRFTATTTLSAVRTDVTEFRFERRPLCCLEVRSFRLPGTCSPGCHRYYGAVSVPAARPRPVTTKIGFLAPRTDPPARSAASPSTAATSAASPPRARGPRPRSGPPADPGPSSRRTTAPNSRRPEPLAESGRGAAGSACAHSRERTPAHDGPRSACASARGGSAPQERGPCARTPTGGDAGVHAARESRRQALHAVRQPPRSRRLDEEVRVVVLHRVVRHPEPGTVPALAQRLPEGTHEAPPAQRRHVVEHAQRDQHRAAPGNGAAAAVRNPRAARARTSGTGPGAAAARGPELEAGLPRPAAPSDLPRPPLACVPRTTFPLHEASPWWVLLRGAGYSGLLYMSTVF